MVTFWEWLCEQRSSVDQSVVESYEREFQRGLEGLIARTQTPELRRAFANLRQFRFAAYIVSALARHGVHEQYDIEDSLQRICFRMLSPVGERGLPRDTVFDIDLNRPYNLQIGNPLRARFCTYLMHELRNILSGRIPALRRTQRPGSLSLAYGKVEPGTISFDQIPGRVSAGDDEMRDDIMALLRQRSTPQMPLADIFQSILAGEGTRAQRVRFGHNRADQGRKLILQTVQQYAHGTQNWELLALLDRFRDFNATRPDPNRQPAPPPKPPKPKYPPDEQDYRSVVEVIERSGRAANLAQLGHYRRRWLERKPRNPASPHPNRLADVLARMVQDSVLAKQGAKYVPGQNYAKYLNAQEPAAVA
jgi:hypothetical protein